MFKISQKEVKVNVEKEREVRSQKRQRHCRSSPFNPSARQCRCLEYGFLYWAGFGLAVGFPLFDSMGLDNSGLAGAVWYAQSKMTRVDVIDFTRTFA